MTELELTDVTGIGPKTSIKLYSAGIRSVKVLANAEVDHLIGAGIGRTTASKIIENAKNLLLEHSDEIEDIEEVLEEVAMEEKVADDQKPADLTQIKGIGAKTKILIQEAGYKTPEDLAKATTKNLTDIEGIGKVTAEKIISSAKDIVGEIPAEEPIKEEPKPVEEEELEPIEEEEIKTVDEVTETEEVLEEGEEVQVRTEHEASPAPQGIPTKKKRGVQISSQAEKIDLDELEGKEEPSGWTVKSKELTEEEREARRIRQEKLAEANRITREIPTAPKPIKAKRKEVKEEKPPKPEKQKKEKKVKEEKVSVEEEVKPVAEYYSNDDIHKTEKYARRRGQSTESGEVEPRIELERDEYLGKIGSYRRSRRVIHRSQAIVKLKNGHDPDQILGKKIYFKYPDTEEKVSGRVTKRFGKKSSNKILLKFNKGIREEGIHQKVFVY